MPGQLCSLRFSYLRSKAVSSQRLLVGWQCWAPQFCKSQGFLPRFELFWAQFPRRCFTLAYHWQVCLYHARSLSMSSCNRIALQFCWSAYVIVSIRKWGLCNVCLQQSGTAKSTGAECRIEIEINIVAYLQANKINKAVKWQSKRIEPFMLNATHMHK